MELKDNVAKESHSSADVTAWGIPGDHHYGETRTANLTGERVPNNRPITVCGVEAGNAAAAQLGIKPPRPGGLGENFLLEGLGDLGDLEPGDQIRVFGLDATEPSVILEVRKQNDPCSNLKIYHRQMPKALMGRRGVICTVVREGRARVGDHVDIVRA
jgi:MOSC domain-containing protein YiiM